MANVGRWYEGSPRAEFFASRGDPALTPPFRPPLPSRARLGVSLGVKKPFPRNPLLRPDT